MYIWWLLIFFGFFFCVESWPNPVVLPELSNWSVLSELFNWSVLPELSNWSASKTFQLVSQQNFPTGRPAKLAKYLQQKPQHFNKMAACNHHCPLRNPAPSLGNWYTEVYLRIFDPGPSDPTTFLGLCSPGDYMQSIESSVGVPTFNSTEKAHTFTIYDCILRIRPKKVCYLTKVSPLDVELI